jgi:hypothetical protein
VQKPHPPVLVGGAFPYSARRAIRYGDGWVPGSSKQYRDIVDLIPRFRQMEAEAGRDPMPITAWYPPRELDLLRRYHELGVERAVFTVPSATAEVVLPALDEIAALMAAVNA